MGRLVRATNTNAVSVTLIGLPAVVGMWVVPDGDRDPWLRPKQVSFEPYAAGVGVQGENT